MKCTIPEISWHNRDPVLSVDIQPVENNYYRLATGGTDCHILIWQMTLSEKDSVNLEVISDLTRHQRAVNVVRWSPSGQHLASGDDDANIIVWMLKTDNVPLLDDTNDRETWVVHKVLRGHKEDVYDLCWSPCASKLLSGSIDNTAILWDLTKGKIEHILADHKGFVQGTAWDPKGDYIATLSSDRLCRLFDHTGKHVIGRISKGLLPVAESHSLHNKEVKYFHDDTFKSYFRRLSFSPDGNLLIAPSGCVETDDDKKALYAAYIFTLDALNQPAAVLPSHKQCTIAIRCCPVLFQLRPDGPDPLVDLPYRMIIAVATDSDVIIYDTQQKAPFAHLQKIHYTRLTDLAWSHDGRLLACSSTDGFCTIVTFSPNELGVQYTKEESEAEDSIMDISVVEEIEKVEASKIEVEKDVKPKKPNLLEQWTLKGLKAKGRTNTEANTDKESLMEVIEIIESPVKKEEAPNEQLEKPVKTIVPKRIIPFKISESGTVKKSKTSPAKVLEKIVPVNTSKNCDAKPIAIRRKPKSDETKNEAQKCLSPSPPKAKRNSLLNFFKSSGKTPDKSKSAKKKAPEAKPYEVITIVDDVEARDAWKCEEQAPKNVSSKEASMDTTEEIPENFKLQVEDSNTIAGKTKINESADNDRLSSSVDESDANIPVESNQKLTEKENSTSAADERARTDEMITSKSIEMLKLSEGGTCDKKTHRRIPLITLSSPKNKTKKKI